MAWLWRRGEVAASVELARSPVRHAIGLGAHRRARGGGRPGVRTVRAPARREPRGALVVVATPIGNLGDLSPRASEALATAGVICCEDTRHTGRLLEHAGVRAHRLLALHAHNEVEQVRTVLDLIAAGTQVVLVSDAGTPVISDPGGRLVAAVAEAGFDVTVVPGPSAGLAALAVSGLDVSRLPFRGVPAAQGDRAPRPPGGDCRRAVSLRRLRGAEPCRQDALRSPRRLRGRAARRRRARAHQAPRGGVARPPRRGVRAERPRPSRAASTSSSSTEHPPVRNRRPLRRREAILRLVNAGVDLHDATTAVEELLGVAHRVAYEAALGLRGAAGAGQTGG